MRRLMRKGDRVHVKKDFQYRQHHYIVGEIFEIVHFSETYNDVHVQCIDKNKQVTLGIVFTYFKNQRIVRLTDDMNPDYVWDYFWSDQEARNIKLNNLKKS